MYPCSHQRHTFPSDKMLPKAEANYWKSRGVSVHRQLARDYKKFHNRKSRVLNKESLRNELRFV